MRPNLLLESNNYVIKRIGKLDFHKLPFKHEMPLSQDQWSKTIEEKESIKVISHAYIVSSFMYIILCI